MRCAHCNKPCRRTHHRQKFCGSICAAAASKERQHRRYVEKVQARRGRVVRECRVCGKRFEASFRRRKICSDECAREAHRVSVANSRHASGTTTRRLKQDPPWTPEQREVDRVAELQELSDLYLLRKIA